MSLDSVLSSKLGKYQHKNLCKQDCARALRRYNGLLPDLKKFFFNDGRECELLVLDGTLPVSIRGVTYNIPVRVWLQANHPYVAPLVYVSPTSGMAIKASRHVDTNGRVHHPFLSDWSYPKSDLATLLQLLCCVFAEYPPVYKKPTQPQPPLLGVPMPKPERTASEELKCSTCCKRFDGQELCPRLLSCGHSFCSGCLEKLLNDNTINCPTCRNAVSVPAGVTGLPKNFAMLDILLAMPQDEEKKGLRVCEPCDGIHSASSCCLECKEDMCDNAARLHARQKATRDHRVVSLKEMEGNPKIAAVSILCSKHNQQFRFFDEDCEQVVCRDCVTLKHNGHKCLSLAEAASKYRHEMKALATKASTHAKEIKAAEARVECVTRDLKQAYEKQAALIQSTFEEFYAALTAQKQVLMNELDQHHTIKSSTLNEQRKRLQIFQICLESAVQRTNVAVQSADNAELLVARTDVVSMLEALESQPLVLEPQTNSKLEFSVNKEQCLDLLDRGMKIQF